MVNSGSTSATSGPRPTGGLRTTPARSRRRSTPPSRNAKPFTLRPEGGRVYPVRPPEHTGSPDRSGSIPQRGNPGGWLGLPGCDGGTPNTTSSMFGLEGRARHGQRIDRPAPDRLHLPSRPVRKARRHRPVTGPNQRWGIRTNGNRSSSSRPAHSRCGAPVRRGGSLLGLLDRDDAIDRRVLCRAPRRPELPPRRPAVGAWRMGSQPSPFTIASGTIRRRSWSSSRLRTSSRT